MLSWQELRQAYGRELISLRNEPRFNFLNTLFSVSEALMYMQVTFYKPKPKVCQIASMHFQLKDATRSSNCTFFKALDLAS